eukprot:691045-Amorphochlora_amoeboformis.AAC.2
MRTYGRQGITPVIPPDPEEHQSKFPKHYSKIQNFALATRIHNNCEVPVDLGEARTLAQLS